MAVGRIEVKTRGFTQVKEFASATDQIPAFAFPLIVNDLKDIGLAAGKASLRSSVGPNSTGNLERSLEGMVKQINQEHRQVEISSDLNDHYGNLVAKFVSQGTAPRRQDMNVQVAPTPLRYGYLPGIWKFIGNHPGTKPNPFLEDAVTSIENNLDIVCSKYLKQGWSSAVNKGKGAPPEP